MSDMVARISLASRADGFAVQKLRLESGTGGDHLRRSKSTLVGFNENQSTLEGRTILITELLLRAKEKAHPLPRISSVHFPEK